MVKTFLFSLIALSTLLSTALGQTPPNENFTPQVSAMLGVEYGTTMVTPAGKMLAVSAVVNPPTISTNSTLTTGKGLLFMMDLDIPVNMSFTTTARSTLLHWFAPGVTLASNHSLQIPANVTTLGGATYKSPSPPAGDIAHQYTWVLFNEPANFTIPANLAANITSRSGFNLTLFAADTKLGTPIAANYMLVQNSNTTTTNGTTTGMSTSTTKATATSTVAASNTASTSVPKATSNVAAALKDSKAGLALGAALLMAVLTV